MTNRGNNEGTSMPETLFTKLNRISETARQQPWFKFRTLAHLINEEMLMESYRKLKKSASAGVDNMTAGEYDKNLHRNIRELHQRLRERRYRAQPLRRVYIDKEDGRKRPLAIPALEDKIVQKAVTKILNLIYEHDFLPSSYGYRGRQNAHKAVLAVQKEITLGKVSYVLEADIQDYFGSVVRKKLMEILQNRIVDKDILRLIGKWLHVGVIDDGRLLRTEDGIYQGTVISPILANIYLHEALDCWIEKMVKPVMQGEVTLIRYADDFVICFQYQKDAKRVYEVLPKRFDKYGLKLNMKKTQLMSFGRFEPKLSKKERRKPNTFDFLGFTFYCSKSRDGRFTVKSKTMSKRSRRGLNRVKQWCRKNRHLKLSEQFQHLKVVLRNHYNYYGLRANYQCLRQFFQGVKRLWKKWLGRRSQRGEVTWDRFLLILKKYPLPRPFIVQNKPQQLELFPEYV